MNIKRLSALALAALLTLSLVACGGGKNPADTTADASAVTTAAPAEDAATAALRAKLNAGFSGWAGADALSLNQTMRVKVLGINADEETINYTATFDGEKSGKNYLYSASLAIVSAGGSLNVASAYDGEYLYTKIPYSDDYDSRIKMAMTSEDAGQYYGFTALSLAEGELVSATDNGGSVTATVIPARAESFFSALDLGSSYLGFDLSTYSAYLDIPDKTLTATFDAQGALTKLALTVSYTIKSEATTTAADGKTGDDSVVIRADIEYAKSDAIRKPAMPTDKEKYLDDAAANELFSSIVDSETGVFASDYAALRAATVTKYGEAQAALCEEYFENRYGAKIAIVCEVGAKLFDSAGAKVEDYDAKLAELNNKYGADAVNAAIAAVQ